MTRDVSAAEFFAILYADPRDIMPSHEYPDRTIWRTRDRTIFGTTWPGWKNPGDVKRYTIESATP